MLNHKLETAAIEVIKSLYQHSMHVGDLTINITNKDFEGDYTLVVFPLLKLSKKGPEDTAKEIGAALVEQSEIVSGFNVVKGFLNLSIADTAWLDYIQSHYAEESHGIAPANSKGLTMIEFSSPNTNKPLHLGHLRNIFLGDSVSRILKAYGHKVCRTQIVNDRGIHICKSMIAWQKFGEGATPESAGMKGDFFVGKYYVQFEKAYKEEIAELVADGTDKKVAEQSAPMMLEAREMLKKWEAKDAEVYDLWKKMNAWVYEGFDYTYNLLKVAFDEYYYESDTWIKGKDVVLDHVEKGLFEKEEDGSVWVDLSNEGLDRKILLRSDGTAVYMTQDIGTAIQRYENHNDLESMVYVVGNEQNYHFKVLFLILEKLGFSWAKKCHHLSYGMVELPEGRMKTREGTVVDADVLVKEMFDVARAKVNELGKLGDSTEEDKEDIVQKIGLAALKFFLLKVDPKKGMVFNPEDSIDFQGFTGPFIQYTYARIRSLLRKQSPEISSVQEYELNNEEKDILMDVHRYAEVIENAASTYDPGSIANYAYHLAKKFNKLYAEHSILNADQDQSVHFRLQLSHMTASTLESAMGLLGIEMPERM